MGSLGAEVVARKPMWVYPKMVGFNPSERWGHSACYSNGLVYVFGGCCGGLHFSDVLVLNLETMGWSALVTKGCGPGPRDSHTAVMWGNTKMVVFGGTNGLKKVNDLHILDLVSNEWTRAVYKGDPPSPRESHTTTLVGDDKLVVFGGSGEGVGNYLNDLYMLDLKTMTWSSPVVKGDHIPAPRDSHVCVGVGNSLFLFGGDSGDRYHGGVEMLDLHTMSWSKLEIEGCSPGARAGHAAVGIGSKIFVIGGVGDKKYYNDAWSLDTETSSWFKLDVFSGSNAVLPQGRFSHTAVVANSDIAIYGGCGEDERPLRELLILQLGAANTYVHVDGEGNNYNNLGSSPYKSLERNQHQLSQHHRQVGRRRIHLGEEKSLHKPKTMILGIEIEAADQKRENKMNEQQQVHKKRKRTTINNNNSNNNSNSNYTTSWEVSEPEEHSHSLSLSSQHSSPSQSDQEQQPSTTSTKITKSSPPTSHQSAAVTTSPPLLLPFLNHQSSSNQHHHPSRRNAVLPNNNTTVAATTIHSTSMRPLPQLQQLPPCHHEVSLPVATEERRLQSLIGAEVQGKVDGAFDSGYLMTAVVNGRIFRGVLFSPVPNVVYRRGDQSLSSYNGGGSRQHHHVSAAVSHQPPPHNTTYAAERGPGLINKPLNSMQPKLAVDSNGFGRTRMSSTILQPTTSSFLVGQKDKQTVSSSANSNDLQGVVLTLGGPGAGSG